jgi:hypothetical protein
VEQGRRQAGRSDRRRRLKLEATKRSWNARVAGADRAITEALQARRDFIAANGDQLIEEHREEAAKATADLLAGVKGLRERLAAFSTIEGRLRGYVPPDRHGREDPRLVDLAKTIEAVLNPGFQTSYSLAPIGLPNPLPLDPVQDEQDEQVPAAA